MDENQIYYLGRVEKNTIVLKQNSNRLSSYASAASDKIPDGNEIAFFRAGENAIVVNENLTIPPWAFCIYIPFGRDAGLIVVGIGKVIAAYRMNSTWTYRYDIK